MKYYALQHVDPKTRDFVICTAEEDYEQKWGIASSDLFLGKAVQPLRKPIFYFSEKEGNVITDIITNNLAWFLVSEEFHTRVMNLHCDEVQFIAVDIFEKSTGTPIQGYAAINVLHLLDVIDYSHSIYYEEPMASGLPERNIVKYSLFGSRLLGHDFIRPVGHPGVLVVSQRVKDIFGLKPVTGAGFRKIKTY